MTQKNRGAQRAGQETGRPGAGKGRKEEVRGSRIYPAFSPLPSGPAEIKTPGSLGRDERARTARTPLPARTSGAVASRRTASASSKAKTLPKRVTAHQKIASALRRIPAEIKREDWKAFLDDFSVEHEDWPTEVVVVGADERSRIEAHDLPLEGITVDLEPEQAVVSVIAGQEPQDHITHIILGATRITALNENELQIASADHSRTIVRCRRPEA